MRDSLCSKVLYVAGFEYREWRRFRVNEQVKVLVEKYPDRIQSLYNDLRHLVLESVSPAPDESLWARLPSYYAGKSFVRLIPFNDHINIEAQAVLRHTAELDGYKVTPKGMLQISPEQELPRGILARIFSETLGERLPVV